MTKKAGWTHTICLDIGNTRMKVGVFSHNEDVEYLTYDQYDLQTLKDLQNKYPQSYFVLSATAITSDEVNAYLKSSPHLFELNHKVKLPFKNLYKTPQTIGNDRLAVVAGASHLYPNRNCLVIDAGTCITLDFINAAGEYLGGSIHPGIEMRLKAVHHFTGKLPLIENQWQDGLVGGSTEECIKIGTITAVIHEISYFIKEYQKKYSDTIVLITGGDTELFFYKLKNKIFAHPNLVLIGLHKIAQYNAE